MSVDVRDRRVGRGAGFGAGRGVVGRGVGLGVDLGVDLGVGVGVGVDLGVERGVLPVGENQGVAAEGGEPPYLGRARKTALSCSAERA